jgi:hypothetical protein
MISFVEKLQKNINLDFKSIIYIFFTLLFIDTYLLIFNHISILAIDSSNLLKYLGTAQFFVTLFGVYVAARFVQLLIVIIKTRFGIFGLEKDDGAYSTDDNLKAVSLLTSIMVFYSIYLNQTTPTLISYWLHFWWLYAPIFFIVAILLFAFGISHEK